MSTKRNQTSGAGLEPGASERPHTPVLLAEVLAALKPRNSETYIDGTFGAGGYSSAILDSADCRVIALDRDPTAIAAAAPLIARYAGRLHIVELPFSRMDESVGPTRAIPGEANPSQASTIERWPSPLGEKMSERQVEGQWSRREWEQSPDHASGSAARDIREPKAATEPIFDGVVLDIGVSSMQLDQPERGFSFQHDGPLDMRMSQTGPHAGASAADIVNTMEADALADILYRYGEERRSRHIARAIVMDRVKVPFTRTKQLADLVARVLKAPKIDGRHAATRTFQALRIYVNDELGELQRGLEAAERILKPGGRLVVVTFHSLEDRIVKEFLRTRSGRVSHGSRHAPAVVDAGPAPTFKLEIARAIAPGDAESATNPRSRSARLRWAIRI